MYIYIYIPDVIFLYVYAEDEGEGGKMMDDVVCCFFLPWYIFRRSSSTISVDLFAGRTCGTPGDQA